MSDVYEATIKDGQIYHSVKTIKNTKGYGWEVKVAGGDKEKVFDTLVELESKCNEKYGNVQT